MVSWLMRRSHGSAPSLVAQRLDWVEAGGLAGRIVAEEDSGPDQKKRRARSLLPGNAVSMTQTSATAALQKSVLRTVRVDLPQAELDGDRQSR